MVDTDETANANDIAAADQDTGTEEPASAETPNDTGSEELSAAEISAEVPENYADFDLPEGVTLDAPLLEKAVPLFKDLKLSQEQAQKLINFQVENQQAQQQSYNETLSAWETEIKADKEIGGDAYEENIGIAKAALEKIGTPALAQFLTDSGAGSHPEVVRAFVKIGRLLKEDNPGAGTPTGQKKDRAEILYPQYNQQ